MLAILGFVILIAIGFHFAFPETSKNIESTGLEWISKAINKILPGGKSPNAKPTGEQKAVFTNIDGIVRVKKKNENSFINASISTPLEKGDVVQTGPEGIAKIIFIDKTSYTIKPDSLIVIEENSTNDAQQTKVSLQVSQGTVDLATANYAQGSQNEVIMAGAKAKLAPESSAQVRNDQKKDNYEILVKTGSGEVQRGQETVSLTNYEKVVFKAEATTMTKDKEVSPPTLLDPGNMISLFSNGKSALVELTWTPVSGAKGYKLRVSQNPYFTKIVMERPTAYPTDKVILPEGQYYWSVIAMDTRGRPSMESDRYRFNILPKAKAEALPLDLEPFIQHGRIIEIRGKTSPGARVMVNGSEIPAIDADGSFRYLIPNLLHDGENIISVTAQNSSGAVNTQTKKIIIQ